VPTSGGTDTQNTVNMSQADTEKLRQVNAAVFSNVLNILSVEAPH
jgi:hypothetical protein